jgi:ribonuclease BN (tRNA processing enzyme)
MKGEYPLVHIHEIGEGGPVMQDENERVTATLVDHPPVVPAFAYRFDATDRSIVISGDTRPCENLVKLAHGADVLVHSALYVPAVDRLVARVPNAKDLKASILAHQTSAEDAGRIAQIAGVKTLVLSHLSPPMMLKSPIKCGLMRHACTFEGQSLLAKICLRFDVQEPS